MNKCILSGRLVANAKVNGKENKVLTFTLAVKSGYRKKTQVDHVDFLPCVLFNPSDKLLKKLTEEGKGLFVELEGSIRKNTYTVGGQKRYSIEVSVNPNTLRFSGL